MEKQRPHQNHLCHSWVVRCLRFIFPQGKRSPRKNSVPSSSPLQDLRDKAQILENFWLLLIWQSWEMRLSQKTARISCFQTVWKYYEMNLSHNISLFPSPQIRKPGDMWKFTSWVTVNILFWEDGWLFGFLLFTSFFWTTEIELIYWITLLLRQRVNLASKDCSVSKLHNFS